jgi:hypothetical protein
MQYVSTDNHRKSASLRVCVYVCVYVCVCVCVDASDFLILRSQMYEDLI